MQGPLMPSKQSVNERGKSRAFCEDEQGSQDEQSNDNRQEPPLFGGAEEVPKLFDDGQLHCSVFQGPRMHGIGGDVKAAPLPNG